MSPIECCHHSDLFAVYTTNDVVVFLHFLHVDVGGFCEGSSDCDDGLLCVGGFCSNGGEKVLKYKLLLVVVM
jgi:hypothetical protein